MIRRRMVRQNSVRPASAIGMGSALSDIGAVIIVPDLETMDSFEVVAAAHARCGHGEEVHAVLKSDLAGGMMPSGRFGANAAWLWLSALAMNVLALLRRTACGQEWQWTRMKRLRAMWIHLVARVVHHGRRITLVFGNAGAHLMAACRRMNLAMPPPAPG